MLITIILISTLFSHKTQQLEQQKTLQLPMYKDNIIDVIDESGFIYKYYLNKKVNQLNQVNQTNCQIRPQHLNIEIQQQSKITHITEKDFEINFLNGKYQGPTKFIQSAVITSNGIITLTSDKNLIFIPHSNINLNYYQKSHFQRYESIEKSQLIFIEQLNLLMILFQDNTVYQYKVTNSTNYNQTIQFISNYKQQTIKTNQIKLIKVYSIYIFILYLEGSLIICNESLVWIYKFESKVQYFELVSLVNQLQIFLMYQNSTMVMQKIYIKDENIDSNDQYSIIIKNKKQNNVTNIKFYPGGMLIVVQDEDNIDVIIDYAFQEEGNLKEINLKQVRHKINNIIIYGTYALLIGDKHTSIITIGIDALYLNQKNYKFKANHLIPQIIDVLMFTQITYSEKKEYIYAYTKTRILKLNLLIRNFEIVCNCQSLGEAQKSPYLFELEYYNSECKGCQKRKSYTLYFIYSIMKKEDLPIIVESIIIGVLIIVVIIGSIIYKYLIFIRFKKKRMNQESSYYQANTESSTNESINDSCIELRKIKKNFE